MSKKQKAIEAEVQEQELIAQEQIVEGNVALVAKENKKEKVSKDNAKKKDNKKKEKKGSKIAKKTKETVSELKKVTWPSFGEVAKKTGVVVAFVLIFGLLIFGVDALLGLLVKLLVG